MIRKAIEKLMTKLSDGLSFSVSGLEALCLMVSGSSSVWTVNLSKMSAEVPTHANIESTYRCSSRSMSLSFQLSSRLALSFYQRANLYQLNPKSRMVASNYAYHLNYPERGVESIKARSLVILGSIK